MKVSGKYIICMRKFLDAFIATKYDQNRKLTHKYLVELNEKGVKIPKKRKFKDIDKTEIISGNVIFVRDENGQVIAYNNPNIFRPELLLEELQSNQNVENAKIQRRKFLREKDLIETKNGDIINKSDLYEEEYTLEHSNRHRVLANRRRLC